MDNMSSKFGLPESLLDAVKNIQKEETEYQMKVKALMKKKGITSLGQLSPEEKKAFFNTLDSMHKAKNEEVELEEAKSGTGYDLYHKDFSSAMSHAYDFAKKKYGIEVDPSEIDRNVAMGPKKPSSGKANAYRLLDKTGKKAIQVQVTNLDNKRYELNMYKEDLDLEESGGPVVYKKGDDHIEKYGDDKFAVYKDGKKTKYYKSMDDAKAALKEEDGASKKKEDQFHTKLDKLVHKTFGHSSDEKKKEKMKKEERDLPFTPDKPKKNPGVVPGKSGAGPSIAKHLAKMAMKKQMDKKKPVKEDVEDVEEAAYTNPGLEKLAQQKKIKKEASSPAQQAAIAISMKKAGKKPKEEGVMIPGKMKQQGQRIVKNIMSEEELDEGMSSAQVKKLRDAYGKIDKIDVSSQPYKNLVAFLDKQNLDTLKMLAGAKIKFISPLAQNRVVRKMNESIGSTIGRAIGQYAGAKMGLEGPGGEHGAVLGRQLEMFAREILKKLTEEKTVGAKKEATGKEKPVKKGEKVSGKQEPITIDPEVDEKK